MEKIRLSFSDVIGALIILLFVLECKKTTDDNSLIVDPYKIVDLPFDSWKVESHKFNYNILPTKLFFTNPSEGYLIGYHGKILHTSDSGKTRISQNSGTTLNLNTIFFVNETTGFVAGQGMNGCLDPDCDKGSILLKTTDGRFG